MCSIEGRGHFYLFCDRSIGDCSSFQWTHQQSNLCFLTMGDILGTSQRKNLFQAFFGALDPLYLSQELQHDRTLECCSWLLRITFASHHFQSVQVLYDDDGLIVFLISLGKSKLPTHAVKATSKLPLVQLEHMLAGCLFGLFWFKVRLRASSFYQYITNNILFDLWAFRMMKIYQ